MIAKPSNPYGNNTNPWWVKFPKNGWLIGGAGKASDGRHQAIDAKQSIEKGSPPLSKAQEEKKVPTSSSYGTID